MNRIASAPPQAIREVAEDVSYQMVRRVLKQRVQAVAEEAVMHPAPRSAEGGTVGWRFTAADARVKRKRRYLSLQE